MSDAVDLPQGDVGLLDHGIARELLASTLTASFAYIALDGTPRVIPTWFHWSGDELVMPTFIKAPHVPEPARRLPALHANPDVAVTIDTGGPPARALMTRGSVEITEVDGIAAEYAASARRYMGDAMAKEYLAMADQPDTRQARIALRPSWVGILDLS